MEHERLERETSRAASVLLNGEFTPEVRRKARCMCQQTLVVVVVGLCGGTLIADSAQEGFPFTSPPSVTYEYRAVLPPGWQGASAWDINDQNIVVGTGWDELGVGKGFILDGNAYTELLPPGFNWAEAYAINNTGTVVGSGIDESDHPFKGFVYRDGQYTSLLPPGWTMAAAYDVNDSGEVVGCGQGPLGDQGFIYDGQGFTELRPPRTEAAYCANGGPLSISINRFGVVAATSYVDGGGVRPFFRWHGGYHFLPESGWSWTSTSGINLWGTMVGFVMDSEGYRGFRYGDGKYTLLLPPGWQYAAANGINDLGIVVGTAVAADYSMSTGFAFWNGMYTEIIPPGWVTAAAYRINNRGVVVGRGYDGSMGMGFVAVPQSDFRSLP